jgi:hypothetical protein
VFLVGYDLTLSQHDLGSLIDGYVEWVNDFSEFIVDGRFIGQDFQDERFRHQCAGFLGVVGNLVTCTIPHGLALAALHSHSSELQVPGDDVGATFQNIDHCRDHMICASTLGVLQFDKVFRSPEVCIYLKRLVLELGDRVDLAPMLIYPLLPYLINPQEKQFKSNRFRLPDRDKILRRASSVLVAFHRDLWKTSRGDIDSDSKDIILLFLRRIHSQVGLTESAIFQGRVYGHDDPDSTHFPHISVKFPVDEDDCLYRNPDLHFASRFVTRMTIRAVSEADLSAPFRSLQDGERIVVKNSKGWRFLEDMGYVQVLGIPGEKVELVGEAARDAFLFAAEPPFREVEVLSNLETHQLIAAGVIQPDESVEYNGRITRHPTGYDLNMQSWRYRKYVDLDDPKSAGFYGQSLDWVNDGLSSSRSSLSPEAGGSGLDY